MSLWDANFDAPNYRVFEEIQAFIDSEIPEGERVDYKEQIPDDLGKFVAALANTSGGLIILGATDENTFPTGLPGFDPGRGDLKTKLVNMIESCVQPRAEYRIAVGEHPSDSVRTVAAIRVKAGTNPPYMCSKKGSHRIYVRVEDQVSEADYGTVMRLFAKRESQAEASNRLANALSRWQEFAPQYQPSSAQVAPVRQSRNWYRFMAAPQQRVDAPPLDFDLETRFERFIKELYLEDIEHAGTPKLTCERNNFLSGYRYSVKQGREESQRGWGLAVEGSVAFISEAAHYPQNSEAKGGLFCISRFLYDFILFLVLTWRYYSSLGYADSVFVSAHLMLNERLKVDLGTVLEDTPWEGTMKHLSYPVGPSILVPKAHGVVLGGGGITTDARYECFGPPTGSGVFDATAETLNQIMRLFGTTINRAELQVALNGLTGIALARLGES
jgi:hypothetical protein